MSCIGVFLILFEAGNCRRNTDGELRAPLLDAHRDLDAAMAAAYGPAADISEQDALAKLLELNLARAAAGSDATLDLGEDAND